MSGPNDNYDPKQVAALGAEALDAMVTDALTAFAAAATTTELKAARLAHVGEKSPIALANREIGALPPAARKDAGQRMGRARGQLNAALSARQAELEASELEAALASEAVDVTLPVALAPEGAIHPITGLMDLMSDVFVAMGWEVAEGPEVEAEWLNFDALNIGRDHPARGESDTIFVAPAGVHRVLRTHTSPVQIRSLLDRPLPVYVVCPGKVYRADEFDATHVPVFHQIEGLVVDKGITMAHLKGTLDHLAQAMFGDVRTRFRPNYFPFTEPSAEMDLWFPQKKGGAGWIEWGGCGMVNPNVLRAAGIDPDVYSGFAFGMGVERTLMFRSDVQDMRDMAEGDVRFSEQFGMVV